jgi:hypothetical protein
MERLMVRQLVNYRKEEIINKLNALRGNDNHKPAARNKVIALKEIEMTYRKKMYKIAKIYMYFILEVLKNYIDKIFQL